MVLRQECYPDFFTLITSHMKSGDTKLYYREMICTWTEYVCNKMATDLDVDDKDITSEIIDDKFPKALEMIRIPGDLKTKDNEFVKESITLSEDFLNVLKTKKKVQ